MTDELRDNLKQMKEIVRELHTFSKQYDAIGNFEYSSNITIDQREKKLLREVIVFLTNQLKILNKSLPGLIDRIGLYKGLSSKEETKASGGDDLTKIRYHPEEGEPEVALVISGKDKDKFLENLSKSRFSIRKLKEKYAVEKKPTMYRRSSNYARTSNKFFRGFSNELVANGYFKNLNRSLRKINSRYVVGTYVSMMLFTSLLVLGASAMLFAILLFFNLSILWPFVGIAEEAIYLRMIKFFWIVPVFPVVCAFLFYIFPSSEAKNLGKRIDQELPFVTIHMSAIASSGVEPISIFRIILKGDDYKYTNIEFKKLMNLINFHGESTANALRKISSSTPSVKLKALLNGLAVTITSGGELGSYLDQHADTMLFDYKLERERNNKISETFMDIYISVAIAAPMILLMIFVIIGSTGLIGNLFNLSTEALSILLILSIVVLNIGFLTFLKVKQPTI
jgi:Flp pilus assembly protein TadB